MDWPAKSRPDSPLTIQIENWIEINLVTLQELMETMPQRMHVTIKANGGPTKYCTAYIVYIHCTLCNLEQRVCDLYDEMNKMFNLFYK